MLSALFVLMCIVIEEYFIKFAASWDVCVNEPILFIINKINY